MNDQVLLSSIRMCNGISSYTHPCIPNQFIHLLKLTRLGNLDSGTGCTLGSSEGFDQFNQFEAFSNLAKDDVGSIQPICDNCGDEELRAISGSRWAIMPSINGSNLRARASIGHREETGSVVLQLEILVGEGFAVNGSTAGALFILDVTTMYKKMSCLHLRGWSHHPAAWTAGSHGGKSFPCTRIPFHRCKGRESSLRF